MPPFCATVRTSLLFMPSCLRISSECGRSLWAKARKDRRKSPAASNLATGSSETAACSCSLRTRCSARSAELGHDHAIRMIHEIVQAALRQRFLVLMLTAFITIGGIISFQRMPVDAYPDLAPPQVEITTQWPGHAAEEVERLVTLPLELEMNGVPHMVVIRSISLYGLSDVKLTFEEDTDS